MITLQGEMQATREALQKCEKAIRGKLAELEYLVESEEYNTQQVTEKKRTIWQLVAEFRIKNDAHEATLEKEDEQDALLEAFETLHCCLKMTLRRVNAKVKTHKALKPTTWTSALSSNSTPIPIHDLFNNNNNKGNNCHNNNNNDKDNGNDNDTMMMQQQ